MLKGIITKFYGNVLKLEKTEINPELLSYQSKTNLYLEASKILEEIDKKKSHNFKKLYAEAMIREGNLHFNRKEYETAANRYERAGQWSSKELLDKELVNEAFRLAINSWISTYQVEKAFRILENLPHEEAQNILKRITEKIGAAAEFLVNNKKYELAKDQLYLAVNKYQREALSDELKYLINKLTEVLIQIFKIQVESSEINVAKNTYEEIEYMWDSYKVDKTDLDSILKALITSFVEKNNFSIAMKLIDKLDSLILKQDLTKFTAKVEEKYKASKKKGKKKFKDSINKEIEGYIKRGEENLTEFVEAELDIIADINKNKIQEANEFFKQEKYLIAGTHLLNHANYLKKIGKEDISHQILTKSLNIFLEGENFEEFFIAFSNLSKEMKGKYLDKLKGIKKLEDYERIEKILAREKNKASKRNRI